MENKANKTKSFFAAANGYFGFRSYFEKIFAPDDYDRIYLIKGGPGTGKSSLLKAIANAFVGTCASVEKIFCSSDTSSLDGVIIELGDKRVCAVDATAPHLVDLSYPGAVDSIINLGEFWDEKVIRESRDRIVELNRLKSNFYDCAYGNLSVIGQIDRKIEADYKAMYNCEIIVKEADRLVKEIISPGNKKSTVRLTASFSKNGYFSFDTLKVSSSAYYPIAGDGVSEYIFTSAVKEAADRIGADYLYAPSPFLDDRIDEIYFPCASITLSVDNTFIDARDTSLAPRHTTKSSPLYDNTKELFFAAAIRDLSDAAKSHMELESIYSAAMDFQKNKSIAQKIQKEIDDIFKI